MIFESSINHKILSRSDRVAAVRFIVTIPLWSPFGVAALPDYVFEYIYNHGTLQDLPWIRFIDDDTEARIIRTIKPGNQTEIARELYTSPFFIVMGLDPLINALLLEKIGFERFELSLMTYLKTYNSKFL